MVIPYCLGRMVAPETVHAPNTVIVWGYILLWGLFELFAVPCIFLRRTLTELVTLYCLAVAVLLVCCAWFHRDNIKRDFMEWKSRGFVPGVAVAVIALVIAQAVFAGVFVHMEADDAEYVVMANDAWERDDLLVTNPYTGFRWQTVSVKRIVSPFSYWVAAVAKITHIAPATVAHVVIPVVFVLLGYTAVYEPLKRLIGKMNGASARSKQAVWTAMLFFVILVLFGGGSTRTYGSMLLLRVWQGKAVFCGIVLPLLLTELLDVGEKVRGIPGDSGSIFRLVLLGMASLLTTGMSLPMVSLVIGAFGLVYGCEWILRKPERVH